MAINDPNNSDFYSNGQDPNMVYAQGGFNGQPVVNAITPVGQGAKPAGGSGLYAPGSTVAPNAPSLFSPSQVSSAAGSSDPWGIYGSDPQSALTSALQSGQFGTGQAFVDAFNQQFGLQPGSSLAYYADSNTYALPGGYAAVGGNGMWGWNPRSGGGGGGTGGGGAAGSGGVQVGASPYSAYDAQRQAQADALYNTLMGEANQSLNITPDDPIIKGQTDAYAAQAQNQWRNTMSAIAEKGGANYNTDAESRAVGEQLAQGTAGFQAKLMANELQSRRDQINQSLSQAAGLLTAEQQAALQDELGRIDAMIGQSEFGQNLAERAYEFDSTVNP